MKKLFYSALALAGIFAVSCNKEMEMPEKADVTLTGKTHTVVFSASFRQEDGLTRTQYADNKTFSWVAGDKVQVRCLNEETEYWYWAEFVAQSSGPVTDLVGEVEDGYEPYDCAVYVPGSDYVSTAVYNGSTVSVVVPISYHLDGVGLGYDEAEEKKTPYWNSLSVPSDNPLSVLPLVSTVDENDVLYFQTGMGVLNLNLTDLDPSATHVEIVTAEKYLGNYLMVADAQINNDNPFVEQEEGEEDQVYATHFMEYYFQPGADRKASLFIPLPVGTIPSGSMLYVLDADDNVLFRQEFVKDVVITRNKILKLTDLKASVDWKDLGTGKYYDWYNWYFMTGSEDHVTVNVQIQQDKDNENHYRVVNPYGVAAEQFGYTAEPGTTPAGAYFEFNVTEDGHVVYDAHCTGVYMETYEEATYIDGPYGYSDYGYGRNYVVRFQSDGKTPAQVALAPIIRWPVSGYWTGDSYIYDDDFIEIDFPGQTPVEVYASVAFQEIVDDSPAQPVASVKLTLGDAFSGAKLVIAATAEAAEAAYTAGTAVTQVSASGTYNVSLPANAASGEYIVFAQTVPATGISALAANTYQSSAFQYDRSDEVWTELGVGKYVDNEVLAEGFEVAANTYTDVEIIQNPNNAANFRVRNPYGAMIEKFGYEAPAAALPSDPFLDLTVSSDGSVYFKPHVTGVYYSSSQFSGTFAINSPVDYAGRTGFNNDHNFVAKYASNGTPANIILAPVYTWPPTDYWTGTNFINSNDFIQIVFPGFTPVDLTATVAFEEIVDDSVSQPVASVLFDPGADIAGAYLVIAASQADANTALANSSLYTLANGSGKFNVKLPANAASGTYYVYAKTIVGAGISEKASEILVSDDFKYDRNDMNLGIKPEDLVGSYTATCSSTFAQNGWASDSVPAVIELSDDENSGDIKFTTFVEEATDGMGIYAALDGATGKVTIDPGQVFATYSFWVDNDAQGNKVYQDLDLVLVQCGTSGGYLVPESTRIIMRYNKTLQTLTVESRQYIGIQLFDHATSAHYGYYGFMYGTNATNYYVSFRKNGSGGSGGGGGGGRTAPARKQERKLVPQQAPAIVAPVTAAPNEIKNHR